MYSPFECIDQNTLKPTCIASMSCLFYSQKFLVWIITLNLIWRRILHILSNTCLIIMICLNCTTKLQRMGWYKLNSKFPKITLHWPTIQETHGYIMNQRIESNVTNFILLPSYICSLHSSPTVEITCMITSYHYGKGFGSQNEFFTSHLLNVCTKP